MPRRGPEQGLNRSAAEATQGLGDKALSAEAGPVLAAGTPVVGSGAGSVVPGGVGQVCRLGGDRALLSVLLSDKFGFELFADPTGAGDGEERLGLGLAGDGGVVDELLDALLGRGEPPTCAGGLFAEVGELLGDTAPAAGGVQDGGAVFVRGRGGEVVALGFLRGLGGCLGGTDEFDLVREFSGHEPLGVLIEREVDSFGMPAGGQRDGISEAGG